MGVGMVSILAATAVVGANLFTGKRWARMSHANRVITGIGVCGSAAALDTEFQLYVEDVYYGNFFNAATGAVTNDHIIPTTIPVPAGAEIRAEIINAATTNPVNVVVQWEDV